MEDAASSPRSASPAGPSTARELHDLLLWVDSRVADEIVIEARYVLADGRLAEVASSLESALTEADIRLPRAYLDPLDRLLGSTGSDVRHLAASDADADDPWIVVAPVGPDEFGADDPPPYWSLDLTGEPKAANLEPWEGDLVEAARQKRAVTALWRSWRYDVSEDSDLGVDLATATLCYLVMVAEPDDLIPVTAWLQDLFAAPEPMVRAFCRADDLPRHHRTALDCGALLWAEQPAQQMRIATSRPLVGQPAPPRALHYLENGTELVVDLDAPGQVSAGPRIMVTDGVWIWPKEVDPSNVEVDLLEHVAGRPDEPSELDAVTFHRVIATLVGDASTRARQD